MAERAVGWVSFGVVSQAHFVFGEYSNGGALLGVMRLALEPMQRQWEFPLFYHILMGHFMI
ncbi:hypothetical protein SAY87_007488 [Trapa incisa]|uniref:Uncharacterized protein n=1 Tax=Trapa incisa TaxID=236973 RepID=A0AAN7KKL2_9MYRT|nr:hypothetical protein SAY87_007488 [Trapa incisa]